MKPTTFLIVLMAAIWLAGARADAETAPTEWNTLAWRADNGQNSTWLWGAEFNTPVSDLLRAEVSYIQGRFNQGGDLEENDEVFALLEFAPSWWQAGLGFSYLGFRNELRRGFVWSYPEEEIERNADIYGPALRLRAATPAADSGFGVAGYGLLMPHDFGDLNDVDYNGRFVEIGIEGYWQRDRLRLAAGYRFRHFNDVPRRVINDDTFSRNDIDGVTLSAAFLF
jgi:hypothetical protein